MTFIFAVKFLLNRTCNFVFSVVVFGNLCEWSSSFNWNKISQNVKGVTRHVFYLYFFCMSEWIFHTLIQIKLIIKRMIVLEEVIMIVMKLKITVALKHIEICMKQINPFQASVTFHVETSHCFAEQNKWLVSIWNATLGWAKMGAFKLIFPTFFS